ncbi:MAG: autotransporter-associated beta strand repeat-containing protein [Planctomycetia bacterium]|nr:autotransporter-associated beta strand repeat-containing protein [Planctomycetia bacterium]
MRSQSLKCSDHHSGSQFSRKNVCENKRKGVSVRAISRFAGSAGACFLATSALFGVTVDADSSADMALTENTTLTVADGGSYTQSGVISGDFSVTKDGAGTLNLTGNNTFSGGLTISEGTLKASLALPTGIRTDTYKPLGTGTVTIGENGTLVWNVTQSKKIDNNDTELTNTITGAGTLRMEMGQKHGNTMFALNSKLSDFTGTLELANNTRVEWSGGTNAEFNKISTIRIESGSQFWVSSKTGTYESDFILNGTGADAGNDEKPRGAFRIHAASMFNGTITLESDSMICAEGGKYNVTFQNDVNLNDHVLTLNQSVGGDSVRTYVFSGDVSTGKFQYNNANIAFTIATSADANYAKDQTISAAIQQNNTTNRMVVSPADGKTIYLDGVISGNGGIHKTGDGTVILGALNTFAGGLVIDAGTVALKNDMNGESTTVTAKQYSAGSGPITINENGTFIWYNQYNNDTNVDNKFIGSGKLVMSAKHSNSANKTDQIVGNMDEFTGTLELRDETRLVDSTIGGTTKIIVQSGAQFWTKGETVNADITLYGNGAGAGGDGSARGAIAASGGTFNGDITLGSDALIGMRDNNPKATFNGNIGTNGYTLKVNQNYKNGGVFILNGNVQSTGDALGKLFFEVSGGNAYSVTIGNATAAESATTQSIAANIDYQNKTGALTFQTAENRTIEVAGQLSGTGNVVKTGTGTLTIQDSAPITGSLTVEGGIVNWAPTTYNTNTAELGYTSGINVLTVKNGSTVNLNTSNTSLSTLTIESGIVNANYNYRYLNNAYQANVKSNATITVGSVAGDSAVLNLCSKGVGDHNGTLTIYDGGMVNINGTDTSISGGNTIKFVGGGQILSDNAGNYFNFRGNGSQKMVVEGADADALITAKMTLYDTGIGTIDVQDASSLLTIAGDVTGAHTRGLGFNKIGAGTLILSGVNKIGALNIDEGTVEFTGNGNMVTGNAWNNSLKVNENFTNSISVADGATLVLSNAMNLSTAGATFTFNEGATLIVNHDGWNMTPVIENALTTGTLGGNGRIVGDIDTTGLTISPGYNGIGTLALDGNLKLSDGRLVMEIAEVQAYDSLEIDGTVRLENVTLALVNSDTMNDIQLGDVIELVSATNLTTDSLKFDLSNYAFAYDDGRWSFAIENGKLLAVAGDSASVPEPATWILLVLGSVTLACARRFRSRK